MEKSVDHLIETLMQPISKQELDHALVQLVAIGEPVVEPLFSVLNSLVVHKGKRATLMHVFARLGYPANKRVLPLAAGGITDINSPAWDYDLEIVRQAGEDAVPFLREMIRAEIKEPSETTAELNGLLVGIEQAAPSALRLLLPDLKELYNAMQEDHLFNPWLKKIMENGASTV